MRKNNLIALLLLALSAEPAVAAPTNSTFILLNGAQQQRADSTTLSPKFLQLGIGNVILKDDGFGNLDLGSSTITNFLLGAGKIFVGNGSGVATQVTMFGDVTISNSGSTVIGAGKVTDAKVSATAAIARTKLGSGTASYVVINNGSGSFSEEQYLSKARGGVGADATSIVFPVSGTLLTASDPVTLTNKILDTTNTINVFDENFSLQDELLTNAKIRFQLSNISPSTTRTFFFPDQNDDLVGRTIAQSVSGKTIDPTTNTIPLASGKVLVGDFSGTASPVTLTGDVTNSNTGVTTIGAAAVDESKFSSSALSATGDLVGGSGTKLSVKYTTTFTADSSVAVNEIVYVKSNGNIDLATGATVGIATAPIGVAAASISASSSGLVYIKNGSVVGGFSGLTAGAEVYLSKSTPGATTQSLVAFSGADNIISLGKSISTTSIVFNPRFKQAAQPVASYNYTSDGVTLTYALGQTLNSTQYIGVYVNGRLQEEGVGKSYTRDTGTGSIVFDTAPVSTSLITVVVYNM